MVVSDDGSVLTAPPITSIPELIDRMAAVQQALPAGDGLACFNRMYQLVTQSIDQHLGAATFADPEWMARLDLVFGNLYLDAVRASVQAPSQVPKAWAALLEHRNDAGVAPLQFALAGMNAHINRDLAVAVVNTCTQLATSPSASSHHADYEQVNTVLAEVEPTIRQQVEGTLLGEADQAFPGLQDVVANFGMVKARDTAWINAETLWVLAQHAPEQEADYLAALDHLAGFAGRGLLVRLAPAPV
jgi:hypothetical protein